MTISIVLILMVSSVHSQVTLDLIIGNSDGTCYAYQNTGTVSSPVWTANSAWNVPPPFPGSSDTAPSYGDLDNDGDWDLLVGENDGECYAFENTGSVSSPTWTPKALWNIPNFSVDARPVMADMDEDCDFDAYVGENDGGSFYFENTGTPFSPTWNAHGPWDLPDVNGDTRPVIFDIDNDGDLDALIGDDDGICYGYENVGSSTVPSWSAKPAWNTPDIGTEAAPTYGDLDGDGDYDLIVGAIDGSNYAIENTGSATSPSWTLKPAWNPPSVSGESEPLLLDLDDVGNTNAFCLALPVELLSFHAENKQGKVVLNWQTKSEVHNDYFDVQFSLDGINWEPIGQREGLGNSSVGKMYEFVHNLPVPGVNYYRLKQVDYDGDFTYSNVKVVEVENNLNLHLYPNPFVNKLNVIWVGLKQEVLSIALYDAFGKKIRSVSFQGADGLNQNFIEMNTLATGVYLIQVSSGDQVLLRQKLVKN